MSIEEIRNVVAKVQELDDKCAFPSKELLTELKACGEALPAHKHSIDTEEFRFLSDYIAQTLFISMF